MLSVELQARENDAVGGDANEEGRSGRGDVDDGAVVHCGRAVDDRRSLEGHAVWDPEVAEAADVGSPLEGDLRGLIETAGVP